MKRHLKWYFGAAALIGGGMLLYACKPPPVNVEVVKPFDANKYLGKWYEIARLDHRFERNLNNVTAEYSRGKDGKITVINRGFNTMTDEWEAADGEAAFVDSPNVGRLKVSFFGPFYSGYNVVAIDSGYRYALVAGENLKYLWILSRDTTIPDSVKNAYLDQARAIGYDIDRLVWITHDRHQNENTQ